jgi:hypothetical protein
MALSKFFKDKLKILSNKTLIKIQFKGKTVNNQIYSISYLQTIKNSQFDLLLKTFLKFWFIKDNKYVIIH